jgi:hypothetical protein
MASSVEPDIEQCDSDWAFLSECHIDKGVNSIGQKRYFETDLSKRIVMFPLAYLVNKCYNYGPLVALSKCYEMQVIEKKKLYFRFQVLCFPHGYNEKLMGVYLNKNYLPQRKILCRDNFLVAKTFHEAAVSFMSEPLLSEEDKQNLGKKSFPHDASVVSSLALNSSMWVIGPFIPLDGNGERIADRLYYRIAAGVLYRSTPDGSYIDSIRSVRKEDSPILSLLWDISLLKFPTAEERPKNAIEKSICDRRLKVLLFCVIQGLCKHQEKNTDLYLQCDYTQPSFKRYITIGFWYSQKHYVFSAKNLDETKKNSKL